jgi:hypothetical protein
VATERSGEALRVWGHSSALQNAFRVFPNAACEWRGCRCAPEIKTLPKAHDFAGSSAVREQAVEKGFSTAC